MSEKEKIERLRETDKREQINESVHDKSDNFSREDVTKMQSPEKWPSPPSESESSNED